MLLVLATVWGAAVALLAGPVSQASAACTAPPGPLVIQSIDGQGGALPGTEAKVQVLSLLGLLMYRNCGLQYPFKYGGQEVDTHFYYDNGAPGAASRKEGFKCFLLASEIELLSESPATAKFNCPWTYHRVDANGDGRYEVTEFKDSTFTTEGTLVDPDAADVAAEGALASGSVQVDCPACTGSILPSKKIDANVTISRARQGQ